MNGGKIGVYWGISGSYLFSVIYVLWFYAEDPMNPSRAYWGGFS